MLRGVWRCLVRCPKPQMIVIICIIVLSDLLHESTVNLFTSKVMEVYNHTASVSEQSLEILLCPMPRVHVGKAMYFGTYMPAFLNWKFYKSYVLPAMTYKERNDTFLAEILGSEYSDEPGKNFTFNTTTEHPVEDSNEIDRQKQEIKETMDLHKQVMLCLLFEMRQFRRTDTALQLILAMMKRTKCWPNEALRGRKFWKSRRMLRVTLEYQLEPRMSNFLYSHFETLDERLLEEYDKLFQHIEVLKDEGKTLGMWLDYISIDLSNHIDTDYVQESAEVLTGPMQKLYQARLGTRMSPRCLRQTLVHSSKRGFQRAEIVYPFYDNCPAFTPIRTYPYLPEYPKGSWCLSTDNMYLSVYISALDKFTDVPMAGAIIPYRVPINQETRLHVSVVRHDHSAFCKNYGKGKSQVTCLEGCLFAQVVQNINCSIPWLERLRTLIKLEDKEQDEKIKEKIRNMTHCDNADGLAKSIRISRKIFDGKEATDCPTRCPRDCAQLIITPRIIGSVSSDSEPAKMELVISDTMHVYADVHMYGLGQFIAEVLGSFSFFVGVSLIALYDWLIGVCLWIVGKLPFIPALKPVIKTELYTEGVCNCNENEDKDDSTGSLDHIISEREDSFLALAFKKRYRRLTTMAAPQDDNVMMRRTSYREPSQPRTSVNVSSRQSTHQSNSQNTRVRTDGEPFVHSQSQYGRRLHPDDTMVVVKPPEQVDTLAIISEGEQDTAEVISQTGDDNSPLDSSEPDAQQLSESPVTESTKKSGLPSIHDGPQSLGVKVSFSLSTMEEKIPDTSVVDEANSPRNQNSKSNAGRKRKRVYRARVKRKAPV